VTVVSTTRSRSPGACASSRSSSRSAKPGAQSRRARRPRRPSAAGQWHSTHRLARPAAPASGSARSCWPEDELRLARQQPAPHLRLRRRELVEVAGDVHDDRLAQPLVGPRRRRVEVDVEPEVAAGPAVRAQRGEPVAGQVLLADEVAGQRRGATSATTARRTRVPCCSPSASRLTTPTARAAADDDAGDLEAGAHDDAGLVAASTIASASRLAPPTGTGMPCTCAAIASSSAGGVDRPRRARRRRGGVRGEQHPAGVGRELCSHVRPRPARAAAGGLHRLPRPESRRSEAQQRHRSADPGPSNAPNSGTPGGADQ
jgi:hypothetical protein